MNMAPLSHCKIPAVKIKTEHLKYYTQIAIARNKGLSPNFTSNVKRI